MKHEMYRDYEQGMDIPCIASRYNLTCSEARELLGVEEDDEENDNDWRRIRKFMCAWTYVWNYR